MPRPRIFFFNRYAWPDEAATAQMLTDLSEALATAGYPVAVIASRQRLDDPQAALSGAETHGGVRILRLRTTRFGRANLAGRALDYLTFYLSAAWFVLRHVARGDVVVAMTDPPLLGSVLLPLLRAKGAHLINWWQDVYPEVAIALGVMPRGVLARMLTAFRNASLRSAAHNVAVGKRMRDFLADVEPRAAPVSVIPNWSHDLPWTPAPSEDNPYRRELGLAGKVVFGYSGNLGRAHPYAALLELGERLRGRSDIHFLFIGSGANLDKLKAEVMRRGLTNWTFLPPQPREKLGESLGAADVHLVTLEPALEGLVVPSKVYGVMAAGRPCLFIGDQRGEVAQLLQEREFGEVVAADDPVALERCVIRLVEDPSRRASLGGAARGVFEERHTPSQAVRDWRKLLDRF